MLHAQWTIVRMARPHYQPRPRSLSAPVSVVVLVLGFLSASSNISRIARKENLLNNLVSGAKVVAHRSRLSLRLGLLHTAPPHSMQMPPRQLDLRIRINISIGRTLHYPQTETDARRAERSRWLGQRCSQLANFFNLHERENEIENGKW